MSEPLPAPKLPKRILSSANLGLLLGLIVSCLLGLYCYKHRPKSTGIELRTHQQPIPSTVARCKELGLEVVNSKSCRPKEPINFYIIEDYSTSAIDRGFNQEYRKIAQSVEDYFLGPKDHISCLGFASSVSPSTLAPHPNYQSGCTEKRRTTDLLKTSDGTHFNSTDFTELFDAVGEAIIEDRILQSHLESPRFNNRPTEIIPPTYHRDLVIIITDGVHDPSNNPPDCRRENLQPLPTDVQKAVQSLGDRLRTRSDEVWLFLVLAPTADCAPGLMKQWEGLQRFGLNVLRADAYHTPDDIARTIFKRILYWSFAIEPTESFSAEKQREQLDRLGWFEMRFRLKRRFLPPPFTFSRSGYEPGPIVGSRIPIKRALLEGPTRDDTNSARDQKKTHTSSMQTHYLFLGDHSSLPQQGSPIAIDTSKDYTQITFTPHQASQFIEPNHDYQLRIEFDGNISSHPVTMPHLWTTRFVSKLHSWQKITSAALVISGVLLGLLFLVCTKNTSEDNFKQAKRIFVYRFRWPIGAVRLLTTSLFTISVAALVTQAWFSLELTPSLPMIISLISALCLQPKTNILVEMLALIAVFLKVAPNASS